MGRMICIRVHKGQDDTILAACDEDILGQTFRGDGMRITVSERFYRDETVSEETFIEFMEKVTIMNLVGERVIALAIEKGYVSEDNVLDIGGVKHAQVVKL